jgi:histone H1/5
MADTASAPQASKPKVSKPKKPVEHPGFTAMITEAIASLKERSGSSLAAIKKYIGDKYKSKLPAHWEKMTSMQCKRMSDKGQLVKVKASYKLGEALKKPKKAAKKPAAKKPAAKKPAVKKTPKKKAEGDKPKKVAKKPAAKKPAAKTAEGAKPKKPKKPKTPKKAAGVKKPKAKKPATKKPAAKKPAAKKAPAKKKAAPKAKA